jgi:tetratricopeptide (TPR) repeat protein
MPIDMDLVLQDLQAAHLIHPSGEPEPTFLFNHVLTQETAYHSLLLKGRRELHLRVAAAFEREYASRLEEYVPTLAYHYWHGEDWPRAARFSLQAGERALRVYALREAMAYYAQAQSALDRVPNASREEICDAMLGWAEAAFGFEPYPKQLEQLARAEQIARQLGDKRRLALILHTIGKVHVAAGHPFRATAPLVECFTLATELGDEKLSVIPTFYMGVATYDSDPRRALGWFDRAIELARRYGDVDIEAYSLSLKAMVEARLGEDGDSRRDLKQAFQLVPNIKSPMCNSDVHLFSAWAFLDLGDVRQGLEYAKMGVDKAVSADNLECACIAFACLGFGHLRAEEIDQAVRAFEEAIRRSKYSGAEPAEILGEMGLGMTSFFSGHPEGVQQIEDALTHARRIGEEFISALLAETLGEIYLQRGDIELATSRLGDALEYFRRHRMRTYLGRALELLANAFDRQGEKDKAEQTRAERTEVLALAPAG